MHWGGTQGRLEVRELGAAVRVRGRFPYDARTELAPGYYETIARGAFAARLDSDDDLHFLSGHDFQKPLASRQAGTLEARSDDHALTIEATIASATSWAADFVAAHRAGLIKGLSPGFRVAKGGERVTRDGDAMNRIITAADLIEVSAVVRPAYPEAQIEARNWSVNLISKEKKVHPALRWRA